ncbi:uncharacterized protein LOC143448335 isoform X2 [Clavelina lepadiformis]|uniref:uncharacterized protein LOC143448335 isoform X2 n=1 Tax=Clavelina lepadiformis TaxID=159417 RepID=UPI004041DE8D
MENILHAELNQNASCVHSAFANKGNDKQGEQMLGGYLNDEKLCWIAKGSALSVIYHGTRKVLSYKNFANFVLEENCLTITSCKKYADLLLVGMRVDDNKGFVCLFNHNTGKVLKVIEIPYPVTCMEVVLEEGGATMLSKSFAQNLRWFFGIVAVGTDGGHLFLIDLRLDDSMDEYSHPSPIQTVPTVVRDVPQIRDKVHECNAHIAFELLDQSHEEESFHYIAPDDQIIDTFDESDISITSLHFEERVTSLFVGFSFGQFHIFDLQDMSLTFSSELSNYNATIKKFAFQEPENDPRNFCYLWIIKSLEDGVSDASSLTATMFQLMYQKKESLTHLNRQTSLYSGLDFCGIRFELMLDPTLGTSPSEGKSNLLQCSTIEHYPSQNRTCIIDSEWCTNPSTSLLLVGWETKTTMEHNVQIILFDINNWYVAHMPANYRGYDEDQKYLVTWRLGSLPSPKHLLTMHSPSSSLCHFRSKKHPIPLQFLQPSAYSFSTYCLLSTDTVTFQMPGIQRQAIESLLENRVDCLIEPNETFQNLAEVGLIEISGVLTIDQKRENILSAALDQGIFSFLSRVISDLSSGVHAASGCTLRFVMDWAWKTVAIVKDSVDNLCVPIFDCSAVALDAAMLSQLTLHTNQLSDLELVFKALFRETKTLSDQSESELLLRMNVVQLIHGYLKILRWCIGARLLPEQLEGHTITELDENDEFHFVYRQKTLKEIFSRRRSEIDHLKKAPSTGLLMIDGIIDHTGEHILAQWRKMSENEVEAYPPPSLMALLDMYYLDNIDEVLKHSIVTYFLIDVLALEETQELETERSNFYETTRFEHREIVSFFPQTFQLSPGATKLIKAFWLLDHKEFQESLAIFNEAGTDKPSEPWQETRILQAYLFQGHENFALQYLTTHQLNIASFDDVKLHIDIFIKNGLPHHALEVARLRPDTQSQELAYFHLFSCCYKEEMLNDVVKISILRGEDDLLVKYLQTSNIPHFQDLLVLHHLKNFRYLKAIQTYRQNKHNYIMAEHDPSAKQQHATLNHIIQGFTNILPDVQKEVAFSGGKLFERNTILRKEVYEPKPLSATLNSQSKSLPLSHASLLSMVLNKTKDIDEGNTMSPFQQRPIKDLSSQSLTSLMDEEKATTTGKGAESTTVKITFQPTPIRAMRRTSVGGVSGTPLCQQKSILHSAHGTPLAKERETRTNPVLAVAAMLLQTPPIKRKPTSPDPRMKMLEMFTPQSILKVKLLKGKSPSLPCISQESSVRSLPTETGSLTSLNVQTSENRDFSRKALTGISTPPVKKLLTNFKGLTSKNLDEDAKPQAFTPKKLRFIDLNNSESSEQFEPIEQQESALVDHVIITSANEDLDVDITGDFTNDITNTEQTTGGTPQNTSNMSADEYHDVREYSDDVLDEKPPDACPLDASLVRDDVDMSVDIPLVEDDLSEDSESKGFQYADVVPVMVADQEQPAIEEDSNIVDHPDQFLDEEDYSNDEVVEISEDEVSENKEQEKDECTSHDEEQEPEDRDAEQTVLPSSDLTQDRDLGEDVPHQRTQLDETTSVDNVAGGEVTQSLATEEQASQHPDPQDHEQDLELPETNLAVEAIDKEGEVEIPPEVKIAAVASTHYTEVQQTTLCTTELSAQGGGVVHLKAVPDDVFSKDASILKSLPEFIVDDGFLVATTISQRRIPSDTRIPEKTLLDELNSPSIKETSMKDDEILASPSEIHSEQSVEQEEDADEGSGGQSNALQDFKLPRFFESEDDSDTDVVTEKPIQEEHIIKNDENPEDDKETVQAVTVAKVLSDPVFILSPPALMRSRQPVSASTSTNPPKFTFSPVSTRVLRSRRVQPHDDAAPPAKTPRKTSSGEQEVTGRPPLPSSARKVQKTPSRKTPARSSTWQKLKQLASSDCVSSAQPDPEPIVTSQTPAIATEASNAEVSQSASASTPLRKSSRERKPNIKYLEETKTSSQETAEDKSSTEDVQPTVTRSSSKKRTKTSAEANNQPTVTRTPSRRSTRTSESEKYDEVSEADEQPSVRRTSSRPRARSSRSNVDDEQPTVTKTSSRKRVKSDVIETELQPIVTKTPLRRGRSKAHETTESERDDPPTVTKTPSRRTRSNSTADDVEVPPTVTRSQSGRRSRVSQPQESTELQNPPTVSRTASRKGLRLSKMEEEKDLPPTVTRSSSRHKTKDNQSKEMELEVPPTVTKTPSRRRKQSSDSKAPASTTESVKEENPPTVTRTSSRRRTKANETLDSGETENESQPNVTRSSSRRKTRSSESQDTTDPEAHPVVTRTPSRRRNKGSTEIDQSKQQSMKKALKEQSGKKKSNSDVDSHPVVSKTPSRRRQTRVTEFETIVEETSQTVQRNESEVAYHSPSQDKIKLIHLSPGGDVAEKKRKTTDSSSGEDIAKRVTRSRKVHFPITSRRRAKVFQWENKKK